MQSRHGEVIVTDMTEASGNGERSIFPYRCSLVVRVADVQPTHQVSQPPLVTLLGHALRHASHGYNVKSHKRSHRITTETARADLMKLAVLGLLDQHKRGPPSSSAPDLAARIDSASRFVGGKC